MIVGVTASIQGGLMISLVLSLKVSAGRGRAGSHSLLRRVPIRPAIDRLALRRPRRRLELEV